MKPMLLVEYPDHKEEIEKQWSVFIQPKLNGWRATGNTKTGVIKSRSGKLLNLPHISKQLLEMGKAGYSEFVDGELYKHGKTLGEIQSMIKTSSEEVELHCFDFMSKKAFSKRFHKFYKRDLESIKFVKTEKINPKNIRAEYKKMLDNNYEGIIIRIDNQPYHNYRSNQVIKLKPECDF